MDGMNIKFQSEALFQRLKAYSAKSGVPMASVVKLAVLKFLDENTPVEGAAP